MGWWRGGDVATPGASGRTRRRLRRRVRPRSFARATGPVSGSALVRPPGSHRASLHRDRGVARGDFVPHPGRSRLRHHRWCGLGSLPCDGADSGARVMRGDQGAETPVRPALTCGARGPQRVQEMHRGHRIGLHASVPLPAHAGAAGRQARAGTRPCVRPGRGLHMAPRTSTLIGFRHAEAVAPFPVSACNSRDRRERTRAESEQREHHDPTPPRASRGVALRPANDPRTSLCVLHRRFSPAVPSAIALRPWDGKIGSASFQALSGW